MQAQLDHPLGLNGSSSKICSLINIVAVNFIYYSCFGFLLVFVFPSAILRNEVGWFDEEEHNSSLLAARLATDAADVKSAIAERISVILQNMTSLLTSFIVAFIVEWRVSLLILATFPLLVLANFAQVSSKHSLNASILVTICGCHSFLLLLLLLLTNQSPNHTRFQKSNAHKNASNLFEVTMTINLTN